MSGENLYYKTLIDDLTFEDFRKLPLVIEGESKEIRYLGHGYCAQYLKPTIYSFKSNRCGVVEGSNIPRMRVMRVMLELFKACGIEHSYLMVSKNFILSKLMLDDPSPLNPHPFIPDDMTENQIKNLKRVPPIEVVVKRFHTGTTKHEMYGMIGSKVRADHEYFPKFKISADEPYPMPIVRFDWRNPLKDNEGNRLADKALPSDMASLFIDVDRASFNARKVYHIMSDFFAYCDIVCYDVCMFFTTDGETMYGEISPDCGRFRHFNHGSLDKDIWRGGGSSETVLEKWNLMADIIEEKIKTYEVPTISKKKNNNGAKKVYIGTSNPYKVSEILSECSLYYKNFEVAPEDDVEEDGKTFLENAIIKAKAYARLTGGITIAEDSGLCVNGLNGAPGVNSARFSACTLNNRSYKTMKIDKSLCVERDEMDRRNREFVLRLLKDVNKNFEEYGNYQELKENNNSAYFECAIAVVDADGAVLATFVERSHGTISDEERGENGFGYDKIFIGEDTNGLTYAELDPFRKNLRSHRTKAIRKLRIWLEENIF